MGYITSGHYAHTLRVWQKYFPPDQIRVIFAEDLLTNRHGVLQEVFRWLGMTSWNLTDLRLQELWNANPSLPPAEDADLTRELCEYYAPFNSELEALIGVLPTSWNC